MTEQKPPMSNEELIRLASKLAFENLFNIDPLIMERLQVDIVSCGKDIIAIIRDQNLENQYDQ